MKWVKTAIGAVIAVVSLGIVATSVYSMTQEKVREEVVTFEVLTETTVTNGTYNLITEFVLLDANNESTNVKSIKVNNIELEEILVYINEPNSYTVAGSLPNNIYDFVLYNDNTIVSEGYVITIGDIFEITFEVTQPPQLSGISAVLLWVIPIIFTSAFLSTLIILLPEKEV